jgi:subtilisin-like proprotein convertase family protein
VIKKNTHATPARWTLSLLLIASIAIAATTLASDKKKPGQVTTDATRPLPRVVADSLSAVGGTWTAQGPAPIKHGQVEGIFDGPVIGAINTVLAHPTNADILWVGSVNGGIWKTTNATNSSPTWTAQTDTAASLSISTIERDPTDATHNTLLAGTGPNSSYYGFSGPLGGLLRTTTGGTTWSPLNPATLAGLNITGIAARGMTVVVTTDSCGDGVLRSTNTTNTSATFSKISGTSGLPNGLAWDIAGDPANNAILYTAITDCSGSGLSGIYKSTNTGATWARVSNATMNSQLAIANNAEIAVGASSQLFVGIVTSNQLDGLFRSGNGGTSWTQLDTPTTIENGTPYGVHPGVQGYLHFSIGADPSNTNLVYVGGDRQVLDNGSSIGANDYTGRLFRVNAAAGTGSQATPLTHCDSATAACNNSVSTNSNSAPHADSRAITFDANGNLLETDDGGIYRRTSPSGTGDWFSVIGNLQITEIHNVVYDRVSNMIMGGNQDNGTSEQTSVGGTVWDQVTGGDGGDVSVDDDTSTTQSTRYSSFQYLGGLHRRIVDEAGAPSSWWFTSLTVTGGGPNFTGQFTTPVELNRVDPRRILFACDNDLYESLDRGDTITALGFNKTAYAIAYGGKTGGVDNLDVIYAISYQGLNSFGPNVFVRTSGGGAPVQTATSPGTVILRDIAVDSTDSSKAYVVNQAGQVFSTSNSGSSWTNITGNIGSGTTDLFTIVHIPGNPGVIAVGGRNGVFRMATNNPGVWNQLGTGMSNAIVYDLDYDAFDDTLVAGTLGRGAWKLSPVVVSGSLPSLSVNNVTVTEGSSGTTNAVFTVTLTPASGHTVGVNYATANDTATVKATTAANSSSIAIPSSGAATPWPSSINVSGVSGTILKVTATLTGFSHTFSRDVDVLLWGPGGQKVILMSDAGGSSTSSGINLTFDDTAATSLPTTAISSGTYRPTNIDDQEGDDLPFGPQDLALSVFNGTSPNGTWDLLVNDDFAGDSGSFSGGWSLTFSTAGGDYSLTAGTLTFSPGVTTRTVSVPVHGDTTVEATETFFVNLTNASNATIGDSQGLGTITNDDVVAPANVVAAATTTTNVNISWTAAVGAATYRVFRSSGGSYTQVGETSGTVLSDPTATANTAYLYKVRSFSVVESGDSNIDLATTTIFTDPTVTSGMPIMKLAYFTELLTAVNAVRSLAGLSSVAFSAPTPAIGLNVRAAYVTDLRNGLGPARSALGLSAPVYADPTIVGGTTFIKATCITELRTGVR